MTYCLAAFFLATLVPSADTTLAVMSFNVRYDNPDDGDNAWLHRRDRVAAAVGETDVAGLQEVLAHQVSDLETLLPEYGWFGVGRDDGAGEGEFSPVFYRKDRLALLDANSFWLSESPDVPGSVGWDAAITRIVTRGRFRDRATGAEFELFNTHFDHRGEEARLESARLILARTKAAAPVIVTGDFNATPSSEPYRAMTSGHLTDAFVVAEEEPQGPPGTWSGFQVQERAPERRIDYVFVDASVRVLRHRIVDTAEDGRYASDHLPVVAVVALTRD